LKDLRQINQHLQDSFLRLAITDTDFLALVAGRVDPALFGSEVSEEVCRICYDFFAQFSEAPKDHFHDELVRRLARVPEEKRELYVRYASKLADMRQPNRSYVLKRINDWVGYREREYALERAAEALERGDVAEHDLIVRRALEAGLPEEDIGLDYFKDHSGIWFREREKPMMPTGIEALDKLIQGYWRGQLIVCLAGYKAGKTWWMIHTCLTALKQGLNVVHLSHEVDQEEMETRIDMALTARTTDEDLAGQEYSFEVLDEKTGNTELKKRKYRWLREDPNRISRARDALSKRGGRLFVKKYPMGQCSPADVEAYLSYLEATQGFVPDLISIDYIDIMNLSKLDKRELRHQLNRGYIWAKGLADQKQAVVITVSQVRREAVQKRWVSMKDVAEDARKAGNCDVMLAIGKGPDEIRRGLAGVMVLANRSGRQDCGCMVSQNYNVGRFCLASWIGQRECERDQQKAADAAEEAARRTSKKRKDDGAAR